MPSFPFVPPALIKCACVRACGLLCPWSPRFGGGAVSGTPKGNPEFAKPEVARVCRGGTGAAAARVHRDCLWRMPGPRGAGPRLRTRLRASCKPQRPPRQTRRCLRRRPGQGQRVRPNFLCSPAALRFSAGTGPLPPAASAFPASLVADAIGEERGPESPHLTASHRGAAFCGAVLSSFHTVSLAVR